MFRILFFSALSLFASLPASVSGAGVVKVSDGAGREWALGSGGTLVGEAKDGGWISLFQIGVGDEKFDGDVVGVIDSDDMWEGTWRGEVGGTKVERRYRLNKSRGVLMVVDSFEVVGAKDGGVALGYSGLWPVKEVAVFTESGRSAEEGFGRGDQGLVVPGRYGDVGVLVAGKSPGVRPELVKDSANRVIWGFMLPEGKHAVVQVLALGKRGEGEVVLSRVLSGGRIIGGVGLDLEGVGELVNFALDEVGGEALPNSPKAGVLVGLENLAGKLGIVRGSEDFMLVSEGSLLSGEIELGELRVKGALGEVVVSRGEVAGIRGGAGRGRMVKVYLRDGRVLAGEVEGKPLSLAGGGGWEVSAAVDDFEGAVFALGSEDGEFPDGVIGVVELHSGDVGFLSGDGEGVVPVVPVVTPWGRADVALNQVKGLISGADGFLGGWLLLEDGSRVEVFVGEGMLFVGEREVELSQLRRFWKPGEEAPQVDDLWADTPEIDDIEAAETSGVWLAGGSQVVGNLGGEVVTLVGATGKTDVEASKIVSLVRDLGSDDGGDRFVVEVEGGGVFKGRLAGGVLEFSSFLGYWRLPAHDVVAYIK